MKNIEDVTAKVHGGAFSTNLYILKDALIKLREFVERTSNLLQICLNTKHFE